MAVEAALFYWLNCRTIDCTGSDNIGRGIGGDTLHRAHITGSTPVGAGFPQILQISFPS